MVNSLSFATALVSLAVLGAAQKCPLVFDSRVPTAMTAATLDTDQSPFNPAFVKGKGLNFSQIVKLSPASSMFDMKALTQTVTVTINETSIFQPSDTAKAQTGFRRAELLATSNDGTDPSTLGVKMLHFSIQKDAAHPLNLSHEYMFSWLETNKYDNDQWNLRGGNLLDQKVPAGDPDTLMFFGSSQYYKPGTVAPLLFQTKFTPAVWHNFGVLMDFNKNLTQVYYSKNADPLKNVTALLPNDVSGQGQYHFGLLKKPVNLGSGVVQYDGTQESPMFEGISYGGIFVEDSSTNCMSMAP